MLLSFQGTVSAIEQALHGVESTQGSFLRGGCGQSLMSDGEQLELVHLLLHVSNPLGQRQVADVVPDFRHFNLHRFVIHREVPESGRLRKRIVCHDICDRKMGEGGGGVKSGRWADPEE